MGPINNRVGVDLLFTDCKLAKTFLDVAANSRNPDTVRRNLENAHKAYEAVMRQKTKLALSVRETRVLEQKLSELKERLESAKHA